MQELIRAAGMTGPCHVYGSGRALCRVTTVTAGSGRHAAVVVAANRACPAHSGILVTGGAITQSTDRVIETAAGRSHRTLREVTINARHRYRIVTEGSTTPACLRAALHGVTTLAVTRASDRVIE
jgi:hypothetical protein